jgi:hypothetical protein
MNRIQLYELAVATGKSLATENNNVVIYNAIGKAAEDNKIDSADLQQFDQYVRNTRNLYIGLANQKLPSEAAAARAAQLAKQAAPEPQPAAPEAAAEPAKI